MEVFVNIYSDKADLFLFKLLFKSSIQYGCLWYFLSLFKLTFLDFFIEECLFLGFCLLSVLIIRLLLLSVLIEFLDSLLSLEKLRNESNLIVD